MNAIITTIIIVIAFCSIYAIAQNSTNKRPLPPSEPDFSLRENTLIKDHVRDERKKSLESLAVSLVSIGILVEVAVIFISLIVADIAIRPVRESYNSQRTFIANASHEMKTPLAAIAANLEAADIKNNRWITNISHELTLLTDLNQELLTLASAENIQAKVAPSELVKIKDLIQEILTSFEPTITSRKLHVKIAVQPQDTALMLPVVCLRQILTILLDNAIKYCDKRVEITYSDNSFCVVNDGKTIPPEKLSQVFDRFYQVDKSREGFGLGLAIAKALAEQNNWKISAAIDNSLTKFTLKVR